MKEKFENKKLNTSDSKHNIPTYMLTVTNKPFMLSAIMINVIMLSVVMSNVVALNLQLDPNAIKRFV